MTTRTPHKHAKELRAFADGYEIQILAPSVSEVQWADCENPRWHERHAFRVKPEPRPNVVTRHAVFEGGQVSVGHPHNDGFYYEGAAATLRIEINYNDPANPVLVSATLEKP